MAGDENEPAPRPSLGQVFTNWNSYDAPFGTKFRLGIHNYWLRVKNRSNCCGNHGEPGC